MSNLLKFRGSVYREAAATDVSTEGLVGELLGVLSSTNEILRSIDTVEVGIHEAKADGDPVSTGANAVIGLLDQVRPLYEEAREILMTRMDVLVGKSNRQEPAEEVEEAPAEEPPEK